MYKLVIYDTSNFADFPIGGQLTSIRNFLRYIAQEKKEIASEILLVGITSNCEEVGKLQKVLIENIEFDFFPVLYRSNNLTDIQKSLRVEYLKSLFKYKSYIPNDKKTIHYIHTPEAFIQIKITHPLAKTVVFSHGSFFNMLTGFRFYKDNKAVAFLFNRFIIWLIKKADLIFTLDSDSTKQYSRYTQKIKQVDNSIVLPKDVKQRVCCSNPVRLLFVGRLSKVKRIDKIIEAVGLLENDAILTIVGDGEESGYLKNIVIEKALQDKIVFTGAVTPEKVKIYMQDNDILVMNSILEGKPMTIIEAMSYGMPIITTQVGGISEMVKPGVNAEYTDGSPESIAQKTRDICAKYSAYSKESIKISKKYDYTVINKGIYEKINGLRNEK